MAATPPPEPLTGAGQNRRSLFEGLSFFIQPCFSDNFTSELKTQLLCNGARPAPAPSAMALARGWRVDPNECSIFITDSINFKEYEQGFKEQTTRWAVTPAWVLQSTRTNIRRDPLLFSPDRKKFFSGICVCASNLMSEGDRQAIGAGVTAYGGQFKVLLTKEVTHFITSAAEGEMYAIVMEHEEAQIQSVLPHWIDDCLSFGTLLPTSSYAFPNPPLLDHPSTSYVGAGAHAPGALASGSVLSAARTGELERMNGTFRFDPPGALATAVWRDTRVFFCADLEAGEGRREAWSDQVCREGGEVVGKVALADVVVGRYREGIEYNKAVALGKTIGSLAWFFDVCSNRRMTSPTLRLLHYPIPNHTIPEFADALVTLTNYTGETREYVKTLIDIMGGKFSPDFSRHNTHVIASVKHGQKIQRAIQWETPIVNHLWVEACFAAWRFVPITAQRRFTDWPEGVNMITLVGERGFEEGDLRSWTEGALEAMQDASDDNLGEEETVQGDKKDALPQPAVPQALPSAPSGLSAIAATFEGQGDTPPVGSSTGGRSTPVPSPLGNANRPVLPPPIPATSSMNLTVPPSSAMDVSPDHPLALKSPAQRRPSPPAPASARSMAPPRASTVPIPEPSATEKEKENARPGPSRTLAPESPLAIQPSPSSHTERSNTTSPGRPALAPKRVVASTAVSDPSTGPSTPSTSKPLQRPPSTQRGLDDTSVILPANSRRKAADRATQKLHDVIMPDVLDYEKAKRNRTLMKGSRGERGEGSSERGSSPAVGSKAKGKAKSVDADDEEGDVMEMDGVEDVKPLLFQPLDGIKKGTKRKVEADAVDGDGDVKKVLLPRTTKTATPNAPSTATKAKRMKIMPAGAGRSAVDPSSVHLLTTQVALTTAQNKWLKSVGAKVVAKPQQCTYLVAGGISRTEKFLCSLATAPVIVDQSWVVASVKAGHFVDPAAHLLKDPTAEARYEIELPDVLARARRYRTGEAGQVGILAGVTFYVTKQVETEFAVLKRIVESHKGKCLNTTPNLNKFLEDPKHHILISCPPDRDVWQPLKDAGVPVYTRELLLGGLIRQKMDYAQDRL